MFVAYRKHTLCGGVQCIGAQDSVGCAFVMHCSQLVAADSRSRCISHSQFTFNYSVQIAKLLCRASLTYIRLIMFGVEIGHIGFVSQLYSIGNIQ